MRLAEAAWALVFVVAQQPLEWVVPARLVVAVGAFHAPMVALP